MRWIIDRAWPAARWARRGGLLLALACAAAPASCGAPVSPGAELGTVALAADGSRSHFIEAPVPLRLRTQHTATLLTDGRVLFVGGLNGADDADASAELYDPSTGTATAVSAMATPRWKHAALALPDGRVLVAGGYVDKPVWPDLPDPTATTELFDPASDSFTPGPTLTAPRAGLTATRLLSGRILLAGGGDPSAELLDVETLQLEPSVAMGPFSPGHAAALLNDGRILFVGANAANEAMAQIFDPAAGGGAGAFADAPLPLLPAEFLPGPGTSLTALRDGRVLALGGCPCGSMGGPTFSSVVAQLFDPSANAGTGAWTQTGDSVRDRLGHSATLLPSGQVLVAGSTDSAPSFEQGSAEIYDPDAGIFSEVSETMIAPHGAHTATLLPSGDVLLFGGEQAVADLYVGGGSAGKGSFAITGPTAQGRRQHTMTRLPNGEVLVVGGDDGSSDPLETAELFQTGANAFVPTGALGEGRASHTASLLPDGRVLVAGGGGDGTTVRATAELYDRTANSGAGAFTLTSEAMTVARQRHSATVLSDGRVLLAGGVSETEFHDTAELYDPATDSFSPTVGAMVEARHGHAAALLPNGKVLLVSGTSAELYDPAVDTFRATGAPGANYDTPELSVLPNGKALLIGSFTLAAELYDPVTEAFEFTDPVSSSLIDRHSVALPSGDVLLAGGRASGAEGAIVATADLFDPLGGTGRGAFHRAPGMSEARAGHAVALLLTGQVLVTGGVMCDSMCPPEPTVVAELWSPSVGDPAWRPVIDAVAAVVHPGDAVPITGSNLLGPSASSGRSNDSPDNHPVAIWQPEGRAASVAGSVTDWTKTSAVWHVPPTALFGKGHLRLVTNGIASEAVPVEITAAALGLPCQFGPECDSGICADGVCCDAVCAGPCEGCTIERKGSGSDGTCGPVPPERDPDDLCVISSGAPCTEGGQCDTGLCVDGVCCDAACEGQCEACDVPGSVGVCVPVLGSPHGARPACNAEPPADLCDTGLCDGVDRATCAATVGPCSPYACASTGCLEQCESNDDCSTGYHCDEASACVPGVCDGTMATTPDGQVLDCSPYVCQADGTCRTSCADVSDCADPFACDFQGRCVSRPPPDASSSGCGCRLGGRPAGRAQLGLLAALLGGLTIARRRGARGRYARAARSARAVLVRSSLATCVVALLAVAAVAGAAPAPAPLPPPAPPATAPSAAPSAGPSAAAPTGEPAAAKSTSEPTSDPGAGEAAGGSADPSAEAAASEQARKESARERFSRGVALSKESAWAAALAEFLASRSLHPTRVATSNAAYCYRKLQRFDESLAMYEALLRDFADLPTREKDELGRAVSELRPLVGTIEIDAAEPGAAIVVDGSQRGTYPLTAPLRASAGTHIVRVLKEGFEPFEQRVDLAGGTMARVQARLRALKESGTLKVSERTGKSLELLVDDLIVGKTPWEGALSIGDHTVRLRGEGNLGTQPVSALVKSRRTTSLALEAEPLEASLRIEPTPANATVAIDSVTVGRGVWEGPLRAGAHKIEIGSEGFLPVVKQLALGQGQSELLAVELERDEDADMWRIPPEFVIDVSFAAAIVPSFGGDVTGACEGDCSQSVGIGVQAQLGLGVEFSSGFGVGIMGGFLTASQEVQGRKTVVYPVGLGRREGTADDSLRLRGPFVGAMGWYTYGEDYPLVFRLAAGPLFAWVRDERTGGFRLDSGGSYQAGPVSVEPYATYLHIDPEVRVGIQVVDGLVLSAGVQAMVLIALTRAQWDSSKEIDAAIDGIGAFENEGLTGPALVVISPGIGLRYDI